MKTSSVRMASITELRPHPLNIKIYGEPNFSKEFENSIRDNGVLVPLLIDEQNQIISGHNRWSAADAIGFDEVPVIVFHGVNELEAESLLIESNRQREKTPEQVQNETVETFRIEEAFATLRRDENLKQNQSVATVVPSQGISGKTEDIVAVKTGQSKNTVAKRVKLDVAAKSGDPTAIAALDLVKRGGSVASAMRMIEPAKPPKQAPKDLTRTVVERLLSKFESEYPGILQEISEGLIEFVTVPQFKITKFKPHGRD